MSSFIGDMVPVSPRRAGAEQKVASFRWTACLPLPAKKKIRPDTQIACHSSRL